MQFGIYEQLLLELRTEDQRGFKNFMRMPPEMFDELLDRVGPRITKQQTWLRKPLEPGLKLALTLRHLASRSSYHAVRMEGTSQHIVSPSAGSMPTYTYDVKTLCCVLCENKILFLKVNKFRNKCNMSLSVNRKN